METTNETQLEYTKIDNLKNIIVFLLYCSKLLEMKEKGTVTFATFMIQEIIKTWENQLAHLTQNNAKDNFDVETKIRLCKSLLKFAETKLEKAKYTYEEVPTYVDPADCPIDNPTGINIVAHYTNLFSCEYHLSEQISNLQYHNLALMDYGLSGRANVKRVKDEISKLVDIQDEAHLLNKKLEFEKKCSDSDLDSAKSMGKMIKEKRELLVSIWDALEAIHERIKNHFKSIAQGLQEEFKNPINPTVLTLLSQNTDFAFPTETL